MTICQLNGSCWQTAKSVIEQTKAHLVAIQETKLAEDAQIDAASHWCIKNGWQSFWGRAVKTDKEGSSSGVAVLIRQGLGAIAPPGSPTPTELQSRYVSCLVQVPGQLSFVFGSVYAEAGTELGRVNTTLLGHLGLVATSSGKPCFFAGDYTMPPSIILASGFLGRSQL